jgi:hypothetical protein
MYSVSQGQNIVYKFLKIKNIFGGKKQRHKRTVMWKGKKMNKSENGGNKMDGRR